jgi:broad specificity phosphatase PhoE
MKLILIRHPALAECTDGKCIGQSDYAAASVSKRSLQHLTLQVKSASHLYSSDLQRTRILSMQLADICQITASIDTRLRELSFGKWENRTWDDIQTNDERNFKKWTGDFVYSPPPDGESFQELFMRVCEWKNEMQSVHPNGAIAAVTHAGVIRAILSEALHMPLHNAFQLCVDYLSCSIVNYSLALPPSIQMLNCR